jgi:hypothetical protein
MAGNSGAGVGGEGGAVQPKNEPPAWAEVPEKIAVREGDSARIPYVPADPDKDTVETKVTAGEGLVARVEGAELVVLGRFDGASTSSVELELSDGINAPVKVSVPVEIERSSWKKTTNLVPSGVEAREHPALLLDEEGKRAFILGGSGYKPYGTPLEDMFQVSLEDGGVTKVTPTGDVPPPGASRRVAPIPGKREAYLFGGYGAQGASNNDLYRVTFSGETPSFQKLEQQSPPSARALHLFAHDPGTGKFFVFGGFAFSPSNELFEGTLEGDVMSWKKLKPSGAKPSGRYGFFYGVDTKSGKALIFSGAQGASPINPARDLWQLDLRSDPPAWSLLLEGEAVPEGRRNGVFAYDEARSLLYVWGGTANGQTSAQGFWVYDGREGVKAWSGLDREGEPPIRSSGAGFVDSAGTLRLGFGNTTSAVFADLTALGF